MIAGYDPLPLRSDTLPPATHTNAVLCGVDRVWIVDPGSPDPDEHVRLGQHLRGRRVAGVILTHRHRDHTAGAQAVAAMFGVEILAHAITKDELAGKVRVDRTIEEGDAIELGGGRTANVLFTPGHARGHIVLWEAATGALVLGDMVAGEGSVIISAPDGRVADYLTSLRRLRALDPKACYPAHGSIVTAAKLDEYIAHRLKRESDIRAVAVKGATLGQVVDVVYATTPAFLRPWAMGAASAHLQKLVDDGDVRIVSGGWENESVFHEDTVFHG